ncbi:MAG: hypothetical protein AB1782_04100, partial [Cyanobacteriota bacterium]
MNNKWIEVFKSGCQTDSEGNTRYWSNDDLDKIVYSYNPKHHEAPVVIGHPAHNAPAYGWVESLKREGNILLAKFKQLAPEFINMVKRGQFKKRSVALYPDLSLRHIGFLGAKPPAVKGLRGLVFSEDASFIEYSEDIRSNIKQTTQELYELSMERYIILKTLSNTSIAGIQKRLSMIETSLNTSHAFEAQQRLQLLTSILKEIQEIETQYEYIISQELTKPDILLKTGIETQLFKISTGKFVPFSNTL